MKREKRLTGRGIRALEMLEAGASVEYLMHHFDQNRGQILGMLRDARARKAGQRHGYTKKRRAK